MEALLWFPKLFFTCTHFLSSMTLKGAWAQNNALGSVCFSWDLSDAHCLLLGIFVALSVSNGRFKYQFEQMVCESIVEFYVSVVLAIRLFDCCGIEALCLRDVCWSGCHVKLRLLSASNFIRNFITTLISKKSNVMFCFAIDCLNFFD